MELWTKLIEQLPSAVAIIIVVVYFIRYIEKRDVQETSKNALFTDALTKLTEAITIVATNQATHHFSMLDAINDMRSVTRRRKADGSASSD